MSTTEKGAETDRSGPDLAPSGAVATAEADQAENIPDRPQTYWTIGTAAFVTDIAQTMRLGDQPLKYLLHHAMHAPATVLADFRYRSGYAWYFKPIAGLISDAFPILGTRRRSYLVISSLLSVLLWGWLGYVATHHPTYNRLLNASISLNVAMMLASTAMGALLVEFGKRQGATGRLSAMREGLSDISALIVGVAAGFLATRFFGWTAALCAALLAILFAVSFTWLREKPSQAVNSEVFSRAGRQLVTLVKSYPLWMAALMTAFIFIAPGIGSLQYVRQTDTLKLSQQTIGILGSAGGATAIVAAFLYSRLCRTMNLRALLAIGVVLNALSSGIYFWYNSEMLAWIIDPLNGFLYTVGILSIFDLAARATPRGSEGLGFALMMAVRNFCLFYSDKFGANLAADHHLSWQTMVMINTLFTLCALIFVPLIPASIMARRDGEKNAIDRLPPGGEPATGRAQEPV